MLPEQFRPERYEELLAEKSHRVSGLLQPFGPPLPDIHPSRPEGFRMRCEFRVWHDGERLDYAMFRGPGNEGRVSVTEFPAACEAIQRLMPLLRRRLEETPGLRRKLFQVEFLSTLSGQTLVTLIYHRPLERDWEEQATALARALDIRVVGRSRRRKHVIGEDFVTERLPLFNSHYLFRQYEQSFTQPNALINCRMIEWVAERIGGDDSDLLELYCGNGNFSLPLGRRFRRVIATEVSKSSVRAALENRELNAVENVDLVRLSAEEMSQAMNGTRPFRRLQALPEPLADYRLRTVLVDPPRAGLDDATEEMVAGFDTIAYVSCNPGTLAANLAHLTLTHEVTDFALFDQFPYTHHMESAVILRRR